MVHKMQPPKTCPLVEQPPRPEVPFVMPKVVPLAVLVCGCRRAVRNLWVTVRNLWHQGSWLLRCRLTVAYHHLTTPQTNQRDAMLLSSKEHGASSNRVLLSVRPTPRGVGGVGGWVGLAEFQGGWVSNPPPPPGWGGTLWGPLGLSSQCHFFLSSVAGSM